MSTKKEVIKAARKAGVGVDEAIQLAEEFGMRDAIVMVSNLATSIAAQGDLIKKVEAGLNTEEPPSPINVSTVEGVGTAQKSGSDRPGAMSRKVEDVIIRRGL